MSNYFAGRNGFGGYNRDTEKSNKKSNGNAGGNSGDAFMNANSLIESVVDRREEVYNDVAKSIASFAIASNKTGASSTKNITEQLDKLLRNFNDAEKAKIYQKAMALVIVNI